MSLFVNSPIGCLEYAVSGQNVPVTVFAHGLTGSIAETRPFGAQVAGTRVFFHFRGHGASTYEASSRFGYAGLAADLRTIADRTQASAAFGLSMGAGALVRLVAQQPSRFAKAVFVRPPTLDIPLSHSICRQMTDVALAARDGDTAALHGFVRSRIPARMHGHDGIDKIIAARAHALTTPGVLQTLTAIPTDVAVSSTTPLREATCESLIIGCHGDPLHPVDTAIRLAEILPKSRLYIFDEPDALWLRRTQIRDLIKRFLNHDGTCTDPLPCE